MRTEQSDRHRHLLALMLLSRESDLREDVLVRQGKGGPHVSSRGHEALIAVTALLEPRDQLFAYYRGCHLMLGKGLPREVIARDFVYRRSSTSGGRSMSVHAGSRAHGIFPTAAPIPSQCLPAAGAAWAQQRRGDGAVTVCSLGDGATRAGEFFEALCFASERSLPILFLVEDNGWAISTATAKMTPRALGVLDRSRWHELDGTDAHAVLDVASGAIARLRSGHGPALLWCHVHRIDGHTSNEDHTAYRHADELAALVDPVDRFAASLIDRGELTTEELEHMRTDARERARTIYRDAEADPAPEPGDILAHMYSEPRAHRPVPRTPAAAPTTMVEATQLVLRAGLESFPELLLFGQDIEDPKGGVFGFTKGLGAAFPDRVHNAPIAEATIIGSAVGLATQGVRPVFEIQFIDFLAPGFNQLVTQVASLRWRSLGQWTCPMVIYAPYGSYIPRAGLWHSQSNEGWWTHIPGLRIAVPSTARDLVGLFWSAFQDDDPTLILIPKLVFRVRDTVDAYEPVPFGRARIARAGRDVTLVAWGNCVSLCEQAAERIAARGVAAEVIDLRTLVPCDHASIAASVARTGRLVVVQEDSRTASFGATIVSELVARADSFAGLLAPPRLVSRPDVHIPCDTALMEAVLPAVDDILEAIDETLRDTTARPAPSAPAMSASTTRSATPPASPSQLRDLVVPTLGEGIREVRIVALFKSAGDLFSADEPLYELESDKAASAIEAPGAGRLLEWRCHVGDVLAVGKPIARLELSDSHPIPATTPAAPRPTAPARDPAPTPAYRDVPLSTRQRALNASFRRSRERAVPATIFTVLSLASLADGASRLLHQLAPDTDGHVSVFEAFALCVSRATAAHPPFRSVLASEQARREYPSLQLGVAVHGVDGDLATAVVDHADALALPDFRATLRAAISDAMEGRDQATDATQLVLTYLGDLGVVGGVPLLTAPASAVLSYGCPYPGRPHEVQVSLSFEHQLINGVEAASFLQTLARCVHDLSAGTDPLARRPELLTPHTTPPTTAPALADQLRAAPPASALTRLAAHLGDLLADLTGRPPDALPADAPFAELGVSSLDLLKLRARLEHTLGLTVPVATFWSVFTRTALAAHLHEALAGRPSAAPASPLSDDDVRIAQLEGAELDAELDRLIDDTAG